MKRLTLTLALVALAAVLAACSGASAAPPTSQPTAPASVDPNAPAVPVVTARDMRFVETNVVVEAGAAFDLVFDNQEAPPHNIQLSDASGARVFTGEIVSNAKVTYKIPALGAGTYTFICEIHPDMKGTLVAE